jgi:acetyl esterase/lipase
VLYDPALDEHVEESRNFNDLARAFLAASDADAQWSTPEGLALLRDGVALPGSEPLDDTEVIEIPGPAGPIAARIRRPAGTARGVYLDIHGGGWCIGKAEATDQTNAALVEQLGITTIAVDYRLAPEHPFPAGPDDCEAATVWVVEHAAAELGSDRLLIGGGSAGAHLTALTLLRMRDRHGLADRFLGANLIFGVYDLGMTPSQRTAHDAVGIPTPVLHQCYAHFLPGQGLEERRRPECSPLYADLHGMPPALFTVGTLDPLLDDSLFMADRWEAAGNRTERAVFPESIHGFVAFPTELGRAAKARMVDFLDACLG